LVAVLTPEEFKTLHQLVRVAACLKESATLVDVK
jgi:hypothetical protein